MFHGNETNRELAEYGDVSRLITLHSILGYVAMWAVRQSPYVCPDNLPQALERLAYIARPDCPDGIDSLPMVNVSLRGLEQLLVRWFRDVPAIKAWNHPKRGHTSHVFVTATQQQHPDDDFIDLDALIRNVAHDVCREHDREVWHDARREGGAA